MSFRSHIATFWIFCIVCIFLDNKTQCIMQKSQLLIVKLKEVIAILTYLFVTRVGLQACTAPLYIYIYICLDVCLEPRSLYMVMCALKWVLCRLALCSICSKAQFKKNFKVQVQGYQSSSLDWCAVLPHT